MKPTVLIVTTTNWVPTARLAVALSNAGFRVEALSPVGHPIGKTRVAGGMHKYQGLRPLRSLARAIAVSKPDVIVPGDDLATRHLHELYAKRDWYSSDPTGLALLIASSLGSPENFAIAHERAAFIELARQEGVRVPENGIVRTTEDVKDWIDRAGLPIVLKADGTSGGEGVRTIRTADEAQRAFRKLQAPPLFARAMKRALVNRDRTLVWPSVARRRPLVSAQAFVNGHEATSTIACWKGTVLASLHFEVLRKCSAAGHATVVRRIEHSEMASAVEKIARRMGLSGLCGFDFMLEANSGHAYLIEINPRATQVGHITLGAGSDLPAALYGAVTGRPAQVAPAVTENDTIALFPHEWARNPQSEFLRSGYHDVPWQTPELVHACIERSRKQSAWYSREAANRKIAPAPPASKVPAGKERGSERPGPMKNLLRVMKFGGTSVGDASCIERVVEIVRSAVRDGRVTVVVSAMGGVTNRLIEAANQAKVGNERAVAGVFTQLRTKHDAAVTGLVASAADRDLLGRKLHALLAEGERLCQSTLQLGELTPRTLDAISALGERLNAPLVAAALTENGIASEAIDATELIVTDACHGGAEPCIDRTRTRCRARLFALVQQGVVPVVTGFIGATAEGVLTTLGRGGSDYSATILGAALDADEVVIWTDVSGLLTADPKLVSEALPIAEISYREAAELAHFGAKVLHPKTLCPVMQRGIPIWIRNTFAPAEHGTKITPTGPRNGRGVTAITAIQDAMLIATAQNTEYDTAMSLITVVGHNLQTESATVASACAALKESENIVAVAHASSDSSMSFVVPQRDMETAITVLHRELELGSPHQNKRPVRAASGRSATWEFGPEQASAD